MPTHARRGCRHGDHQVVIRLDEPGAGTASGDEIGRQLDGRRVATWWHLGGVVEGGGETVPSPAPVDTGRGRSLRTSEATVTQAVLELDGVVTDCAASGQLLEVGGRAVGDGGGQARDGHARRRRAASHRCCASRRAERHRARRGARCRSPSRTSSSPRRRCRAWHAMRGRVPRRRRAHRRVSASWWPAHGRRAARHVDRSATAKRRRATRKARRSDGSPTTLASRRRNVSPAGRA